MGNIDPTCIWKPSSQNSFLQAQGQYSWQNMTGRGGGGVLKVDLNPKPKKIILGQFGTQKNTYIHV